MLRLQERAIAAPGAPLEARVRRAMEARLGGNLGGVRVSTDAAAADALGADAFTRGQRIVFGAGRYAPHTPAGEQLLAHELVHALQHASRGAPLSAAAAEREADRVVERSAPAPGAVSLGRAPADAVLRQHRDHPPLRPDPTTADLLAATPIRESAVRARLAAHPEEAGTAQTRLIAALTDDSITGAGRAPYERLAVFVATQFPTRRAAFDAALLDANDARRHQAEVAVHLMWSQYADAALIYAFVGWCTQRIAAFPRRARGTPPAADEATIRGWLADAQARLEAEATQRTAMYQGARSMIGEVMRMARPFSYIEEEALDEMNATIRTGTRTARRGRQRIARDRDQLDYVAPASVTRQLARLTARRDAAHTAVTAAPPGRARQRAEHDLRAAERALTPAGAPDSAMRRHLEMGLVNRPAVRADLDALRDQRDEGIATATPIDARVGAHAALLTERDRWQIYQAALDAREHGFPHFNAEYNTSLTLDPRSRIAEDRAAIGFAASSVGTYAGHGEGAYDVMAHAGRPILARRPDLIDLSAVFGETTGTRMFGLLTSEVRNAQRVEVGSADGDVLAKLAYGFFGRAYTGPQVEAFFSPTPGRLPARNPDAGRIVAGLAFENTVEGDALSASVRIERDAILADLERDVRADLAAHGIALPSGGAPIFHAVSAASGDFGGSSAITTTDFLAVENPRTHHPFTRPQAVGAVLTSVGRLARGATPVASRIEGLIRTLRTSHRGGRSGPAVQLTHHYREAATHRDAWIVVSYRHMRQVEDLHAADRVAEGAALGQVGSTGNAISPHVHMSIEVFLRDPGAFTRDEPADFLEPLDFFPMMRAGRTP